MLKVVLLLSGNLDTGGVEDSDAAYGELVNFSRNDVKMFVSDQKMMR